MAFANGLLIAMAMRRGAFLYTSTTTSYKWCLNVQYVFYKCYLTVMKRKLNIRVCEQEGVGV